MQQTNHFSAVIQDVQDTPKNNRPAVAIAGIAKQMEQSSNQQTQQLGQELKQIQSQLVSALQQS